MSVNLSDYVNGKNTVREITAVRGSAETTGTQGKGGQELPLKAGEQLRGTVVETDAGKVVIETKDHGVFTARLENGMQVNKGDVMDFEVRGMQGRQITLTPLYSNMSVDSSVLKALQAASLPVTEAHVRMVNEMMSQGMGIDRQALQGMSGLVGQYRTASPELLVQMKQLGLPITNDSVMQAESYRNNTAQIVNGFGETGKQIYDLMRGMAQNGEYEALGKLFTEAAKLFAEGELAEGLSGLKGGTEGGPGSIYGQAAESMDGVVRLVTGGMADGDAQGSVHGEAGAADGTAGDGSMRGTAGGAGDGSVSGTGAAADHGNIDIRFMAGSTGDGDAQGSVHGESVSAGMEDGLQADGLRTGMHGTAADAAGGMSRLMADGRILGEHEAQAPGQAGAENAAGYGEHEAFTSFLKSLSDTLAKQAGTPQLYRSVGQELSRMLGDPQFGADFQNALIKKWLLTPQEAGSKQQVQDLYESVLRQTGQLKQMLADAGKQDSAAMKSLDHMQREVEFLNELNQNFAYVQLPLKMSGQHANGDLYVYTNKKGFAGRDGAVTAFLHLGMDHLGDMDVYVAIQRQKVSTKFYLEDDSIIDFLETHMDELNRRLAGKGYLMKSELLRKDHEDHGNVFDQMLKDSKSAGMSPQILLSRQSFDARA